MREIRNLQIINGDGMLRAFQEAKISGDLLIWREVLSEGPVISGPIDEKFWEVRSAYLDQLGDNTLEDLLLKHLNNVDWGSFNEITLWFEHDLVCQVNLIFLLSFLYDLKLSADVTLVCIDRFEGLANFKGLGQLSPRQLSTLYPNRILIKASTFQYATKLWRCYAQSNPIELKNALDINSQLPFINDALELHFLRFPDLSGLSSLQRSLLQIAADSDATFKDIMHKAWKWDPGFGLTDLSIKLQFIRMSDCFIGSTFRLSDLGLQVLSGQVSTYIKDHFVGGAKFHDFTWDPLDQKIIRNEEPT